jgi:leucyl aminopeptidase
VLVGKGVMYDTGGYSLKPASVMGTMKCDMSGAAAVAGTIMALAANKVKAHVVGLIPATDNRVNADALVPDDIITISDGTTVEVLNTDAEGRLILADALHYAKQYQPRLVIDLATLTGSAMAVTGNLGAALMGTDLDYREALITSGLQTHERVSEIPYWKEFADMLKGDIADLKNIGGPIGGAATAGKFLEHFTANEYPWLHLDIAGPAFLKEDQDYKQKGASGFGVRLLYHFICSQVR